MNKFIIVLKRIAGFNDCIWFGFPTSPLDSLHHLIQLHHLIHYYILIQAVIKRMSFHASVVINSWG